ncbi:MAG TPA: SDR family NAD(P)-dependent oxidoreductase [Dehalococcoidia bacterium]|nr:SDR family NAD(P)-dependent oxidoreductase [Dehalococcoidia bacterium]
MPGQLDGKVALITGGGSGIGRACALRFAREGARVCSADLNLEAAAETVRQVERGGGAAQAVQVDTTDEQATEAMVQRCVEAFGAVDVLVAAAGILAPRPGQDSHKAHTVVGISAQDFKKVLDVNLWGVMFSNRAAARWMLANSRSGSIVNLASTASKLPLTHSGGAYSVSKAAVWMWTKVLALELAPSGIRVNAIGPGLIETPMTAGLFEDNEWIKWRVGMTPLGRAGRPEEVAATALFLASDESSYFTGELLHPAGGTFLG